MFALGIAMVLAVALPISAQAQNVAQKSFIVEEIVVQGTHRIEQSTVRSYLLLQEGDNFDRRRVDQSLKSLFATGLFADVVISREGKTLFVKVVENPVINRIAFEGNKRIDEADLQKEVVLRPRVVFTRTKVQADVKRVLEVYRVNGRFGATVVPKIIQLPQNRADLVFEIDEGPLTKVERISFVGNKAESDSDLRSVIRTKETIWYRFLSSDDTYDPDRLTLDRELLRRHYLAEGFADFRVESAVAELTPDGKAFFITFSVNEGQRYKFGNIDVAAGLRGLNAKQLKALIKFKKGDEYDNTKVDGAIDKITDAVGNLGFAFVEVRPRVNRNRKEKIVDITFDIREGPRVFVERIDISGNVRTIDKVIRREFQIVEGDAFNAAKLRRSRQRIQNLDFFNKVNIQRLPGSTPDKTIVKVEIEEKSTGSLSFGVGFSTDSGALLDLGLRESNLLGRGQALSFNGTLAAEKSTVNISFTEPYFLDRDIAAGFDLYHVNQDLQDTRSYDFKKSGLGLRAGFQVAPFLRQNWRYKAEVSSIENVASSASSLIQAQEGKRYLSEVGHSLTYDRRDSRIAPTEGYVLKMINDLAGFGGNIRYLKNQLRAGQYYEVTDKWVLGLNGRVGHILGLDQHVNIADRFFLGGTTLRGFKSAGAGPRDISTDDSLGGEWIYNGSLQLRFPLGLPAELGLSGRIFSDFGSLGQVNPSTSSIKDSGSIRASAGAGIGWVSPFGPMNIDFGFPLAKESYDKTELMRINFGTRF
ncbi:MAG: outer membrane protein assembly factor BamA [Rhodospirillaceae bacterium]|nr:outer membrane protein assembly factor BamA [Rhodospirillaceae bacterium]